MAAKTAALFADTLAGIYVKEIDQNIIPIFKEMQLCQTVKQILVRWFLSGGIR